MEACGICFREAWLGGPNWGVLNSGALMFPAVPRVYSLPFDLFRDPQPGPRETGLLEQWSFCGHHLLKSAVLSMRMILGQNF